MSSKCRVLLVGFEEWENLGLRYMAAYLQENGIEAHVQPYAKGGGSEILEAIRAGEPSLVGFSLIFQRMLPDFAELIAFLRENGVGAHFTMGGHFPTVDCDSVFEAIPGLDSIVRCEGEDTLLELARKLDDPAVWRAIKSLAYRGEAGIEVNPSRALRSDLDSLPFPTRPASLPNVRGVRMCSLCASRGCSFDCCFCSIREFYSTAPGPNRRYRSPSNVADEMEVLHKDRDVRIFVFEDDDFAMRSPANKEWIRDFVDALKTRRLADDILWRISCRVDEIDSATLSLMSEAGLTCVYLGIESGSDQGLRYFNKHYSVDDVHRSIAEIRKAGMPFEFGFMIMHPECTFDTIMSDIGFLKRISSQGDAVVHFTKMLPYAGTAAEAQLIEQKRLTGDVTAPDYPYRDPRLDLLQMFFTQAFHYRNFDTNGLVERLRYAKLDALVAARFRAEDLDSQGYLNELYGLIEKANFACLERMSMATRFMKDRSEEQILSQWWLPEKLAREEVAEERRITTELERIVPA